MAERLTEREGKHTVRIGNEWRRHDPVWDKLADYEDLEEQGRLIILPEDEGKVQAMNEKLLELTDIAEAALKGVEE